MAAYTQPVAVLVSGKHFGPKALRQPAPNFRDHAGSDSIRAKGFEALNDQPTFPQLEAGLFQGRVFEDHGCVADPVGAVRAIRQIHGAGGNLGGQAQQVLRDRSIWLDSPAKLPRQRMSHLIDVWTQLLAEELAGPRIIVDSADNPTDLTLFVPTGAARSRSSDALLSPRNHVERTPIPCRYRRFCLLLSFQ